MSTALERIRQFIFRHRDGVIAFAIFLFSTFFVFFFARVNFEPHHTGLMYKTALDVAEGKILFRDTFAQYGALTSLLQALSLLLLGKRITSILWMCAAFYAGCYALFFLLARRVLPRPLALIATAASLLLASYYFWDFIPWSSIFSLFFMLLSLLFFLDSLEKDGWLSPFLVGAAVCLTFWCRQPVGIVALLSVLLSLTALYLLTQKRRFLHAMPWVLLGTAAMLLVFFIPFFISGAFHDFYRQSIEGMLRFAADRSQSEAQGFWNGTVLGILKSLFAAPFTDPATIWHSYIFFVLPISSLALALGLFIFHLLRAKKGGATIPDAHAKILVISVMAVAAWHQYYPVICFRHWYWAAFPAILPLFFLLQLIKDTLLKGKKASVRHGALALSLLLLFGTAAAYRTVEGVRKLSLFEGQVRYENEYFHHLDGLYLRPAVAEHFDTLFCEVAILQATFPDVNIINTTENGIYAVFGENFCPLFNNSGDFYYEEYPQLLADYIAESSPIVIGPHAPTPDYVLYREQVGDSGDYWEDFHRMPANIYLPSALYLQLH